MKTKAEIHRYRRFGGYDYSRGGYLFITVSLEPRRQALGRVVGSWLADSQPSGAHEGQLTAGHHEGRLSATHEGQLPAAHDGRLSAGLSLSPAGEAVEKALLETPRFVPGVALKSHVIMPDHVHLRVYLKPDLPEPLKTLGRFMAGFKRVAAKNSGVTWQQGYHDRICLSRFINEKVDAYIAGNPLKWLLMHGPDAPLKVHEPLDSPRFPETEWWTAAGNLALLSPERRIAAVSVSRSLRPGDIPAVVARLLKAAREGWVVASTFISPGEIAVRQALEAEKRPCIKAVPDSLEMVYRPKVEETEAFAEGRLLVVSRQCGPEVSRYDAWHGMGAALAAAAAAVGGGTGVYVHRKGTPEVRWEAGIGRLTAGHHEPLTVGQQEQHSRPAGDCNNTFATV